MRVFVTGSRGFLGSRLCKRLEQEHQVVEYDLVLGDTVLDAFTLDARVSEFDPDVIVHLAGPVLGTAKRDPLGAMHAQTGGTLNVLKAAADVHARLVLASSFYVYDGIPSDWIVNEATPLRSESMDMFGLSKFVAERMCEAYGQVDWAALRFGSMYGGGGSNVIDDFMEQGRAGKKMEIWGPGARHSQYTHVDDVVEGVVKVVEDEWGFMDRLNLISPEITTIRDLAATMHEMFGFEFTFDESKPEGASMPYMSSAKAIGQYGWEPRSLTKGLASM